MVAPEPRSLRTVAVIPARGGSKGVPGKNLKPVGGRPLVVRAVEAARAAELIDGVFVSTDDDDIAEAAERAGADVIRRPDELSGDQASSESALLHALDQVEALGRGRPEILAFIQCTSPFVRPEDLDRAVARIADDEVDCVFSAVSSYAFWWRDVQTSAAPGQGEVVGINHDAAVRPLRQNRRPDFAETGAFYVMRTVGFRQSRHRFFGRIGLVEVPELTAVEIDNPAELVLAELLSRLPAGGPETAVDVPIAVDVDVPIAVDVDAVITDFDGVHTDDLASLDQYGTESVRVSRADGMGVERLRRAGIPLMIISKERNPVVTARGAKLDVEVLQGIEDKVSAVRAWITGHGLAADRVAYLGNDVNDLGAMAMVGWPVAVQDARPEVRDQARLVLSRPGGRGAVRELCDLVLAARAVG